MEFVYFIFFFVIYTMIIIFILNIICMVPRRSQYKYYMYMIFNEHRGCVIELIKRKIYVKCANKQFQPHYCFSWTDVNDSKYKYITEMLNISAQDPTSYMRLNRSSYMPDQYYPLTKARGFIVSSAFWNIKKKKIYLK